MSLETVSIEHIPPEYVVYLCFYRDVENAAFLHQQLLDRNAAFEYAFIDASVVRKTILSCCPLVPDLSRTPGERLLSTEGRKYAHHSPPIGPPGSLPSPAALCSLQGRHVSSNRRTQDTKCAFRDCAVAESIQ